MAEYIDREALIAEYDRVHIGVAGGARKLMVDAPAADVVEVVRCKNCKCYEHMSSNNQYFCNKYGGYVNENDYCSRCERRSENG